MIKEFVLLVCFTLFVGCGVSPKDYNDLKDECSKLSKELAVYKQRYGEIPVMDKSQKKFGIWEVNYYVDDFGESTSSGYVSTGLQGVFSNSATTNSALGVRFLVDKKSIRIQLYEYARNHPIKGESFLSFKAKNENGEIVEFKTYNADNGHNTVVDLDYNFDDSVFRDFLLNSCEIAFIGSVSNSEYKFTLKNNDFLKEALAEVDE